MILAIDTCQDQCALSLLGANSKEYVLIESAKTGQAELLFPLIQALLELAACEMQDLTQIGVTIGPGNFTGIRIGLCAAQGLGMSLNIPVKGVTTLAAWAQTAQQFGMRGDIPVLLDARKNQKYRQEFTLTDAGIQATTEPVVEPLAPQEKSIGSFGGTSLTALSPTAICRLVAKSQVYPPEPFYIRSPDAVPSVL